MLQQLVLGMYQVSKATVTPTMVNALTEVHSFHMRKCISTVPSHCLCAVDAMRCNIGAACVGFFLLLRR